jgi:hypothetical protein
MEIVLVRVVCAEEAVEFFNNMVIFILKTLVTFVMVVDKPSLRNVMDAMVQEWKKL